MTEDIKVRNPLTLREQYIISQALYVAIEKLAEAENPEHSNIKDMQTLLDEDFPIYNVVAKAKSFMSHDEISEVLDDVDSIYGENVCGTTE
jgi:hypothetical protein